MRTFPYLALTAMALLIAPAHGREQTELRERVKDATQRTGKDLGTLVQRDKLDDQQRTKFDAAAKELDELREAAASNHMDGQREKLEHAIENIDFVVTHAAISEGDKQTLGIDLYTLRTILDNWKP
jgi:hypothetical protein